MPRIRISAVDNFAEFGKVFGGAQRLPEQVVFCVASTFDLFSTGVVCLNAAVASLPLSLSLSVSSSVYVNPSTAKSQSVAYTWGPPPAYLMVSSLNSPPPPHVQCQLHLFQRATFNYVCSRTAEHHDGRHVRNLSGGDLDMGFDGTVTTGSLASFFLLWFAAPDESSPLAPVLHPLLLCAARMFAEVPPPSLHLPVSVTSGWSLTIDSYAALVKVLEEFPSVAQVILRSQAVTRHLKGCLPVRRRFFFGRLSLWCSVVFVPLHLWVTLFWPWLHCSHDVSGASPLDTQGTRKRKNVISFRLDVLVGACCVCVRVAFLATVLMINQIPSCQLLSPGFYAILNCVLRMALLVELELPNVGGCGRHGPDGMNSCNV